MKQYDDLCDAYDQQAMRMERMEEGLARVAEEHQKLQSVFEDYEYARQQANKNLGNRDLELKLAAERGALIARVEAMLDTFRANFGDDYL